MVINDVERFLKRSRLDSLVVEWQQKVVNDITDTWVNDSYQGPMVPMRVRDWVDTTRKHILSP